MLVALNLAFAGLWAAMLLLGCMGSWASSGRVFDVWLLADLAASGWALLRALVLSRGEPGWLRVRGFPEHGFSSPNVLFDRPRGTRRNRQRGAGVWPPCAPRSVQRGVRRCRLSPRAPLSQERRIKGGAAPPVQLAPMSNGGGVLGAGEPKRVGRQWCDRRIGAASARACSSLALPVPRPGERRRAPLRAGGARGGDCLHPEQDDPLGNLAHARRLPRPGGLCVVRRRSRKRTLCCACGHRTSRRPRDDGKVCRHG
jgi:hypothetical protein